MCDDLNRVQPPLAALGSFVSFLFTVSLFLDESLDLYTIKLAVCVIFVGSRLNLDPC